MDDIQTKFPMRIEQRNQMTNSSSAPSIFTIVLRLKSLETCFFDIPTLDDAIKLAESLDALIANTSKLNECFTLKVQNGITCSRF